MLIHPQACLIQGTLIGWTVLIGIVLAAIMLGPPLWFSEVETGYMYTGAFVGALLGFLLCGLLSDWSARLLTRRNDGVYEPEFRMVLVIPQLILGCAGLYGFGWCASEVERYGWFWMDFWFACEVAGMVCGAVASALYVVDAHRKFLPRVFPPGSCEGVFGWRSDGDGVTLKLMCWRRRHVCRRLHVSPGLQEHLFLWLDSQGL